MICPNGSVRACFTHVVAGITVTALVAVAYGQPLQNPYEENPFGPLKSAEPAPGTASPGTAAPSTAAPDFTKPDRPAPETRGPRTPDRAAPSRPRPDSAQPRTGAATDSGAKAQQPATTTRNLMDDNDNPFADDRVQPGEVDKKPSPTTQPPTQQSTAPPRDTTEMLEPSDVPESEDRALFAKINELMAADKSAELIPLLETVVQRLPQQIDVEQLEQVWNVFNELGKAYRMTGRYDEAIMAFGRAAALAPTPEQQGEAHLRRGIVWFYKGEPRIAIAEFEQAVSTSVASRDPRPEFWKGLAFAQQGRYRDAISAYSNSLRNYDAYTVARNNRGLAYLAIGELDFAVTDFDEVIRQTPDDGSAYHKRAIALARRGDLREAVASYGQAIRLAPDFAPSYYNRGRLHRQLGNAQQADADLAKARQLNPQIESLARPPRLARR